MKRYVLFTVIPEIPTKENVLELYTAINEILLPKSFPPPTIFRGFGTVERITRSCSYPGVTTRTVIELNRTQSNLIERLGSISSIIEHNRTQTEPPNSIEPNRTQSLFWEFRACDSFHTAYPHFSRTQSNRESTVDRRFFFNHNPDTIRTQSNLIELNRTYRAQLNAIECSIGFDCSNSFVRVRLCSITELNQSRDWVRLSSIEFD